VPAFCVSNARAALGDLAAQWRRQFELSLIGVTGSNGKTTVTQMIASVLRADTASPSLSTQGNLNNEIGVPLTLFNLRAEHRRAVVELGMNHPGEIEVLAQFAQPSIGLVNNAQREHQEFMSTVEAVAIENGEVIRALPAKGVAVFPAQDAYTQLWQKLAAARPVLTFGFTQGDVQAHDIAWRNGAWSFQLWTQQTTLPCRLNIAGRHNILNALAATACALAAGMSLPVIVKGLESFEPVKGRSKSCEWQVEGHAFTLVDDTYNANPDSVRAAIEVLAELPAPRLLVLGDMGEVGLQGAEFHQEVGAYAKACAIQSLFTLGDLCQHSSQAFEGAVHFSDMDSLQARVLSDISAYNSVLVKGSRFMKMERVVEALRNKLEQTQASERESVHAA
jgi:UDP-N-acetylmuramoyl-tripeptide--D-alanyl-D-alanine ligase